MPPFGPVKRRELIRALRALGFVGPECGGSHEFMRRGSLTLPLPNPHRADVSKVLLAQILRIAGITKKEWETV